MKFELVHDHLAKAIYDAVSIEQQQEKHAYALIEACYQDHLQDQETFLKEEKLEAIRPFLEKMELSKKKKAFVQKSQHKLLGGKRRRRIRNYTIIAVATMFVFLPLAIWGVKSAFYAKSFQMMAEEEMMRTHEELEDVKEKYRRAIVRDSMLKVVNMNDLKGDNVETIRNVEEIYATMQLSGRVVDKTGRPIADASIMLMGARLKTNKKGEFDCFFVMPPLLRSQDEFYLDVEKNGYQPIHRKVKPDAEVELKLTLNRKQK